MNAFSLLLLFIFIDVFRLIVIVVRKSLSCIMHLSFSSMTNKKLCSSIVVPLIRRYATATQQTATAQSTARSSLVRFIEQRRRRSQQDDIRLEPYMSKGVYTESGAIRPVNQTDNFSTYLLIVFLSYFRCPNDILLVLSKFF